MKQLSLFLLFSVLFISACGSDDDDSTFTRIGLIGRLNGWRLEAVDSDYATRVNNAIDALSEEELAGDSRTREEIRAQYEPLTRIATTVDECDQDDLLFFVENGTMRIIQGDVTCPTDGDPNPLARFNNQSYIVNTDATAMQVRAASGELIAIYQIIDINSDEFNFEAQRLVNDSIFTDLTYRIRYDLVAN